MAFFVLVLLKGTNEGWVFRMWKQSVQNHCKGEHNVGKQCFEVVLEVP